MRASGTFIGKNAMSMFVSARDFGHALGHAGEVEAPRADGDDVAVGLALRVIRLAGRDVVGGNRLDVDIRPPSVRWPLASTMPSGTRALPFAAITIGAPGFRRCWIAFTSR